jgi:hypothetical protein
MGINTDRAPRRVCEGSATSFASFYLTTCHPPPLEESHTPASVEGKRREGNRDEKVQTFGGKVLSIEVRRDLRGLDALRLRVELPPKKKLEQVMQVVRWWAGGKRLARDDATRRNRNLLISLGDLLIQMLPHGSERIISCLRSTFIYPAPADPQTQRVSRVRPDRELEEY